MLNFFWGGDKVAIQHKRKKGRISGVPINPIKIQRCLCWVFMISPLPTALYPIPQPQAAAWAPSTFSSGLQAALEWVPIQGEQPVTLIRSQQQLFWQSKKKRTQEKKLRQNGAERTAKAYLLCSHLWRLYAPGKRWHHSGEAKKVNLQIAGIWENLPSEDLWHYSHGANFTVS